MFGQVLKWFAGEERGSVAMMFGVAAIPTILGIGLAIDYSAALSGRAKLDAAADAAGMAAITTAKTVIQGYTGTSANATATAVQQGQAAGLASFQANAGVVGFVNVPTPTINVTRTNQTIQATVTYATAMKSSFGPLIGLNSIALGNTAQATLTMPTYINYYVIVDTSQSMGIGSTAADMQNLYNLVVKNNNGSDNEIGCVFGCHVLAPGQKYTNENLAHNASPPITLRIDAAASAFSSVISLAKTSYSVTGKSLIRLSLWSMQDDPTNSQTNSITQLAALETYPFTKNTTAVGNLDLGNNNSNGVGDTNFTASLNYFANNVLSSQGDGSTQANALNFVFLITDGVQDVENGSCQTCHVVTAFDSSLCTALKYKSTVGVIYTTYNPIYSLNQQSKGLEANYNALVAPIVSNVVPNLQDCATYPSSQWYFQATDGPAITAGMQALFKSAAQQARVSQ